MRVRINSLYEFMLGLALLDPATGQPLPDIQQYAPVYYPILSATPRTADIMLGGKACDVEPEPGTVYYLYNSVKLFYQKRRRHLLRRLGGDLRSDDPGAGKARAGLPVNPNLDVMLLTGALPVLAQVPEVTMIVVPDATLLTAADSASLNQQILAHCAALKSRVAIFDVPGGDSPDPVTWETDDIVPFRTAIGLEGLA